MNIMVGFSSISPFFFLTFLLLLEAPSFSVASDEAPAEAEREDVVVNTVYGRLRGFSTDVVVDQQQAREGEHSTQRVNVFLGVPFARPPVGDLRFEKPVPPSPWPKTEVRDATAWGPVCPPITPQFDAFMRNITGGAPIDEDCLYLNIIAPAAVDGNREEGDTSRGFPVAFLIHGGGYIMGSAREFRWRFFAEQYARRGILVVLIQYRLAFLGFSATGDSAFGGNYGLFDQTMALRYVHENIAAFGGDPRRVTIWGHSAGGGSVSSLSYSPYTRGLFAASVEMSGSVLAEWSLSERVMVETATMATEVGCASELRDPEALKRCLRRKSVVELQRAVDKTNTRMYEPNLVRFGPRLDGDFFPDDPERLVSNPDTPKRPTIIGASDAEFLLFGFPESLNAAPHWGEIRIDPADYTSFNAASFDAWVAKSVAVESVFGPEDALRLRKMIVHFYLGAKAQGGGDYRFYLSQWNQLYSDIGFMVPILIEAKAKARAGWPVYFYLTDYFNPPRARKHFPIEGAFHAVEYPAMYGLYFWPEMGQMDADDQRFQRAIVGAFCRFFETAGAEAHTRELPSWTRASTSGQNAGLAPYAVLNQNAEVRDEASPELAAKLAFWERVRAEFPYDVIRGLYKGTLSGLPPPPKTGRTAKPAADEL